MTEAIKVDQLEVFQYLIVYLMLLVSLIPVVAISRSKETTERIAYASSFGNKLALIILVSGVFRGDWMIACIGAFILIVGDAGMLILSLLEMRI